MLLWVEGRAAGFEIVEVIATYLDACNNYVSSFLLCVFSSLCLNYLCVVVF